MGCDSTTNTQWHWRACFQLQVLHNPHYRLHTVLLFPNPRGSVLKLSGTEAIFSTYLFAHFHKPIYSPKVLHNIISIHFNNQIWTSGLDQATSLNQELITRICQAPHKTNQPRCWNKQQAHVSSESTDTVWALIITATHSMKKPW